MHGDDTRDLLAAGKRDLGTAAAGCDAGNDARYAIGLRGCGGRAMHGYRERGGAGGELCGYERDGGERLACGGVDRARMHLEQISC